MRGDQMTEAATKLLGQVVGGKFRLGQFVGANERSAVFLTECEGQEVRKAAIKLITADSAEAEGQLARWRHAANLSHPHLIRLLEMGSFELNDKAVLYVVMEFAEENLSQVVARRPLAPAEARVMLGSVMNALAYVHAMGFVHCRLKPANIMADNDLLKISSDGLCRIGESSGSSGTPGAYDPPEASAGRISPAGDVWSLGMTLVEVLTQRLPVWERTNQLEPRLPPTLPAEFIDLARHCLRRDPQLRWTVADIAARLQQNSTTPPRQMIPSPQPSITKLRTIGAAVLAGLALVAILAGPRLFRRHSQNRPAAAVEVEQSPVQSSVQPKLETKNVLPTEPSSPIQIPPKQAVSRLVPQSVEYPGEKKPAVSNPTPAPTRVRSESPATTSSSGVVHGKVVQQVLPDAPQKARDTIHGKVRVGVKVHVDESGTVTEATFDSLGPSKYFAERVLKAAQQWKFAPAKMDGRNAPSEWLLRFEIDPATINVYPTETTP
jgi:TonB family protein